ncbi:type III-B CRISPR module RAMP protein Cmr6 [Thermodesulfatator autotrophicus]|uniref:CRISPR type III-associated protein domain-containing protein n=1 Tax=Thermodesulfatator autotrophicus TaxID=1795632 RepID=A0A177E566_9BACT|nr:type III-B CRISPR module RAMP protein Cmr6 [Thermodesulfatator autotrophicus]OAG26928.1 hypothetical protein TH606_09690 [Thermodesulfatator autotrophicus]
MPKGNRGHGRRPAGQKGKPWNMPQPFRPLPDELSRHLQDLGTSFNFGLYFNKWLFAEWKTKDSLKFPKYQFQAHRQARKVLENYQKASGEIKSFLEKKHREIDGLCRAFQNLGYEPVDNKDYKLKTPLIIGLGNAHPTERGFTLHWTLGIPYLPAESIKGVVRLAYLINKAEENPDFFEHWAAEDKTFWECLAQPFGREEKEGPAERGKVVFLDAFPMEIPELTLEITTCHYPDYYGGERGPTEDQNPNPLPFLAIAPEVAFRFVFLMDQELAGEVRERFLKAFKDALSEHGFGAKTALGHGRFA